MLRVSPNVMADDILQHFQINATNFGLLMSLYYMGYAGMQIPIGLLLDMYGPRYVATTGALLCAMGGLLFASTDHWYLALLSRLMIGMGSSAAFISTSKVIRLWFPEKYFSIFVAFTVTLGLLGAFSGGKPTAQWVALYGWKYTLLGMSFATLAVSAFIYMLVKNSHKEESQHTVLEKGFFKSLISLMIEKQILWVAFFGALLTGPLCAFADVWGVSYLVHAYGLDKPRAAEACAIIYIGMAAGGPLLAFFGSQHHLYKKVISLSGAVMAAVLIGILSVKMDYKTLIAALFIMGVFCSYHILMFALVLEDVPKKISGVMVGFVNTINMLSGLFYLPIIGFLLDTCWTGQMLNGTRIYSAGAYKVAFSVIIIGLIIGAIGFLLLRNSSKKEVSINVSNP